MRVGLDVVLQIVASRRSETRSAMRLYALKKMREDLLNGASAVLRRRMHREIGGPGRTRTYDQGIHCTHPFPDGADYLITLDRIVRGGTL